MIKIKNTLTEEELTIHRVRKSGDFIVAEPKVNLGSKFREKFANVLLDDGHGKFTLAEGWEFVMKSSVSDAEFALLDALRNIKTEADVDEDSIVQKVVNRLNELLTDGAIQESAVRRVWNTQATQTGEIYCENFEMMLEDVKDGFIPYLWGAAGCGKSHTAEQIANKLGLDFYPMQRILFDHQVEGFANANGELVETPFYKAFRYGGLVFFDEFDSGSPEGTLVVNAALANGRYTFPVVGCVKAHPDFRVMCAGNTVANGSNALYTGRSVLDASTRDRLVFYEMTYDRRIELPIMANNDEVLVDFMEDLRQAVVKSGIEHIVSYRSTKYMEARKNNKIWALRASALKGLNEDEVRVIYGFINNKENKWAKAMKELVK